MFKNIPIDTSDPMNGLVTYLKINNQLKNVLSISASSTYSETDRTSVNTLFERSTTLYYQNGEDRVGEYIEIGFLGDNFITLTVKTDLWRRQKNLINREAGTSLACRQINRHF